ncbi:MAG: ATP-binding protein [Planctomycetota bacterium]
MEEAISLEDQVKILKARLLEAQKMTALGELSATTTHEFNNVLMSVINYARMGLRNKDEATRDKALTRILEAGERAAKITNSILGMARNRSASLAPTDIDQLIQDALLLLEREMRKYRIQVDYVATNAPLAQANGNQVQQVLLNLLINARQAMPEGGELRIRLTHDPAESMVCLVVRDHGTGIPQSTLTRIFEPYFSTKSGPDESGKGGTGLGLSACRDIIQSHGGRIRVESTVGVGTQFTIRLPVAQEASRAVA